MKISTVVEPKEYEIGVIVARYQVDEIHEGQKRLMNYICSQHKKVILFLGVGRAEGARKNAMDFATRKIMVQNDYPNIVVLPQLDQKEDDVWSKNLDNTISLVYGDKPTLLYGSRDSFIPYYTGRHTTTELAPTIEISGTEIRERISKEIVNDKSFRAGIIYNAYSQRPKTYPTVDVVAYNDEGQILMVKKPNEKQWRFVGGFVDTTDKSYEMAGRREFGEEVNGCHIGPLKYVLSSKVDDWRYRGTENGIMTTLFMGRFGFGQVKGTDDIEQAKWFDVSYFTKLRNIENEVFEGHQDMLKDLVTKVYTDILIPNLGTFHKDPIESIDPDVVVKDETFKIK